MAFPYKPISWDKYYSSSTKIEHASVTSGLAAGITIGVFFTVFLLTFGCRLYNRRLDRRNSASSQLSRRRWHSVSDLFLCGSTPTQPPPPYEVAIKLPKPVLADPLPPPPFSEHNSAFPTDTAFASPTSPPDQLCPAYNEVARNDANNTK